MAEKNFYFAIEDGSTVFTEYKSDLELKPLLRRATKDDEILYETNINGCLLLSC